MSLIAPSFAGQYIFGGDVTMVTIDPHRETQVNAFLGVNGVEILDHGARQRYTQVTGRFEADDEVALGMVENAFRSFRDAYAYTLVTTEGLTWLDVKLESFQPQPPIRIDGYTGRVWRRYEARFIHCR